MSKHIPLPLERRGTMVYTDECQSCAKFICQCRYPEQADEIIAALEMHPHLKEALEKLVNMHAEAVFICGKDDEQMVESLLLSARAALNYPPKKETTP